MQRSHHIKLRPNKEQAAKLQRAVGVARFVYNWGIDRCEAAFKDGNQPTGAMLSSIWTHERPEWTRAVFRGVQTKALLNLGSAYKAFFAKKREKPVYHKRGKNDSAYFDNAHSALRGNCVYLAKIGEIRLKEKFRYAGIQDVYINSIVISHKADGWYASIQCELPDEEKTQSNTEIGIDLGIATQATCSDGTRFTLPKARLSKLRKQIRHRSRVLSRRKRGSHRYNKARRALALKYQQIARISHDAIHKFTHDVAKNHGCVYLETLCVVGMGRSGLKSVRRGVKYSCMSEIARQLEYKCKKVVHVGRLFPSSKTCSRCGYVYPGLKLNDRVFQCSSCGFTLDRDLNAAMNILAAGRRLNCDLTEGHSVSGCGA